MNMQMLIVEGNGPMINAFGGRFGFRLAVTALRNGWTVTLITPFITAPREGLTVSHGQLPNPKDYEAVVTVIHELESWLRSFGFRGKHVTCRLYGPGHTPEWFEASGMTERQTLGADVIVAEVPDMLSGDVLVQSDGPDINVCTYGYSSAPSVVIARLALLP